MLVAVNMDPIVKVQEVPKILEWSYRPILDTESK
jgi:hypothetical protein